MNRADEELGQPKVGVSPGGAAPQRIDAAGILRERTTFTERQLSAFADMFRAELGERAPGLAERTCVVAVGSGGRREMSAASDLDLFLVQAGVEVPSRTDEVLLQSAVIRAQERVGLPPPSNDASFLKLHTAATLRQRLGEPADDIENTFTVRMLLLLESRALFGEPVYERIVDEALDAYWVNAAWHPEDYLPILFVNDVIRYWRNVLLNYEFKNSRKEREQLLANRSGAPSEAEAERAKRAKAERWLRSYKLRFGRCLTCYATLALLLAEARFAETSSGRAHVAQAVARQMVQLTPLERLQRVALLVPEASTLVEELVERYVTALNVLSTPRDELVDLFSSGEFRRPRLREAELFGDRVFELLQQLGRGQRLYRYLMV